MHSKLTIASLLLAAGLALPGISQADRVGVNINIGPPAPIVETPPPPQAGYVWAPGFHRWNGARYVWVPGHYMVGRPGFRWIPEHYVRRGPYYRFVPGHWAR